MQLQRPTINKITIKITKSMNKKFLYISCPIISLQTSHPELFRVMKFGIVGTIAMIIHYSLYYVLMNIIEVKMAQIHQATPHLEVLHLGNLHLAVRNNFKVNI